jgi:hypothetical protein
MRQTIPALLLAACALPLASTLACGGGTPSPKDENDVASASSAAGDDSASASSGASSSTPTPAPAASSSTPLSGPASAATTDAAGDIKATNTDDPWLAAHQMPPGDVMKTMRGANGKVQGCWKAALKNDPSTSGEVKIRFVITNDGKVRASRDDGSSMTDEDVTKCVAGVLEKLKFPKQKSPGDAWGIYSIHFAP